MVDDAHDLDFERAARATCRFASARCPKAIGAYGGYLCASQPVIDLVRNRARTLIYSTGLPPAIVAAAIAALDLIEREPAMLAQPLAKARAFTAAASLPAAQSAIVPVVLGEASAALRASQFWRTRVSRRCDPSADGAGQDRTPALQLQRAASRRRDRKACRHRAHAHHRQRMTAIFVTATGTDIGKTFVVRGLIRHLRAAGWPVEANSRWRPATIRQR